MSLDLKEQDLTSNLMNQYIKQKPSPKDLVDIIVKEEDIEKEFVPLVGKTLEKYSSHLYTKELLEQKQETLRTTYETKENNLMYILMVMLFFVSIVFSMASYFGSSFSFVFIILLVITIVFILLLNRRTGKLRDKNDQREIELLVIPWVIDFLK